MPLKDGSLVNASEAIDKADTELTQPPEDGEKEVGHESQDEEVCHWIFIGFSRILFVI